MGSSEYPWMLRNFENVVLGRRLPGDSEACSRLLGDLVHLRFRLAGDSVSEVRRDLRVTLADQLASLGGTLGLFTGMSVLSFCEVLFWTLKAVLGSVWRGHPRKRA